METSVDTSRIVQFAKLDELLALSRAKPKATRSLRKPTPKFWLISSAITMSKSAPKTPGLTVPR